MKTYKRQKIIDSAITLFRHTHNINKVSIEAIAIEAHVSPTTIYNNFGTRDSLLNEVIKLLVRENVDRNIALIHSDLPFPQKLTQVISGKVDLMNSYNWEVLERIISQDKAIAPFVEKIYQNEIRPLWMEMLADGKKQGYISPELNEEALLMYLDIIKTGFSVKQDILRNTATSTDLLMQLTRIFFHGFLQKEIDFISKENKSLYV